MIQDKDGAAGCRVEVKNSLEGKRHKLGDRGLQVGLYCCQIGHSAMAIIRSPSVKEIHVALTVY